MASQHPLPLSLAPKIATYSPLIPGHEQVEEIQVRHRINLINAWNSISPSQSPIIKPGARILELGCGQGTITTLLAECVGPTGHIDAVDPGDLNYGSPFTLGQAQEYILTKSPVGGRIKFHQADPVSYLSSTSSKEGEAQQQQQQQHWDVAVLSHCIWYFQSPSVLSTILSALKGRVDRVCIAEYALHATNPRAIPHLLAVVARGMIESFRSESESEENVRTPIGPRVIKELASPNTHEGGTTGWKLMGETNVVPHEELLDGHWEAGTVMDGEFEDVVCKAVGNERTRTVILGARDMVVSAVEALPVGEDGKKGRAGTMDVWVAVFEEAI